MRTFCGHQDITEYWWKPTSRNTAIIELCLISWLNSDLLFHKIDKFFSGLVPTCVWRLVKFQPSNTYQSVQINTGWGWDSYVFTSVNQWYNCQSQVSLASPWLSVYSPGGDTAIRTSRNTPWRRDVTQHCTTTTHIHRAPVNHRDRQTDLP